MAQESVAQRLGAAHGIAVKDQLQLITLMNSLVDALRVVTAKLDADAGVTDVNYTALFDAAFKK